MVHIIAPYWTLGAFLHVCTWFNEPPAFTEQKISWNWLPMHSRWIRDVVDKLLHVASTWKTFESELQATVHLESVPQPCWCRMCSGWGRIWWWDQRMLIFIGKKDDQILTDIYYIYWVYIDMYEWYFYNYIHVCIISHYNSYFKQVPLESCWCSW